MNKFILSFCLFLGANYFALAQNSTPHPFQDEINAFAKADSLQTPVKNSILFVGSSSFRKWTDINDYFPGYPIINRGFGGSVLTDVIYYAKETILKYHPKQIYIYCGENDIASSEAVTPEIVLTRFKDLLKIIRVNLNGSLPVVFVSLKPSVARWNMEERIVKTNNLIKQYIAKQKNVSFLDIHNDMLDANGQVYKDIFLGDNLHMNAKGYAIWQKIIYPKLLVQ
jgi:lysophospholipase L1-like esterase